MGTCTQGVWEYVAELGNQAVDRGIPRDVADIACAATSRALGHLPCGPMERRRLNAYHAAVMRRALVRRAAGSHVGARLIAQTVVEDLRSSGRSNRSIADELRRGWSDKLPRDLIEAMERDLCA